VNLAVTAHGLNVAVTVHGVNLAVTAHALNLAVTAHALNLAVTAHGDSSQLLCTCRFVTSLRFLHFRFAFCVALRSLSVFGLLLSVTSVPPPPHMVCCLLK